MNEGNHLLQQLRQKKRILNPKGGKIIHKFNLQGKEKERKLKNSNSLIKWYTHQTHLSETHLPLVPLVKRIQPRT